MRSGELIQNLTGAMAYQSFRPSPLPPVPPLELSPEMCKALVLAHTSLSRLDAVAARLPDLDLFISMYLRREAVFTSQIEGTQCTLDDLLEPTNASNANLSVGEVLNCLQALHFALERLETLPLCNRLLQETHAILIGKGRGQDKTPGEFRHSQNWLGPAGCTLRDARYVPPNVEDMLNAMHDWELYLHREDQEPLIQLALAHYQFETIHPFLDGNGRLGRLLIPLVLVVRQLLSQPVIYVSYFLKKNQVEYYDRLTEVRRTGNYEQWVFFFLEAIANAAKDALENIEKISALHQEDAARLVAHPHSTSTAMRLFEYIKRQPIIAIGPTAKALGMSYNTISGAIRTLETADILASVKAQRRNRLWAYSKYLEILRD